MFSRMFLRSRLQSERRAGEMLRELGLRGGASTRSADEPLAV
jgi:hypothetical protein